MRLATLRDGSRDGALVVVTPDGEGYVDATDIAPNLQTALDHWVLIKPRLEARAQEHDSVQPLRERSLAAPLPRAYEWLDGSAYISHIELVRKARGAELPPGLRTDPLVYQGGSGVCLGAHDPMGPFDESWGIDFEAEICVILTDTPMGTPVERAHESIALVMLANDTSLRNLVPYELKKGFGFVQSKPSTTFSPFAVTLDELGSAFSKGRLYRRLESRLNGRWVGAPESGAAMHFSFLDLIAHVTKTRALTAGTMIGSGTVSNHDAKNGVGCLAEQRMREIIQYGEARTPFLKSGDVVEIEMLDEAGKSIFGCIRQRVEC